MDPSSTYSANASARDGESSAGRAAGHGKEAVTNAAKKAGEKITSRLDEQRYKAAEGIGSIAQALRQTGDQLRGQDDSAAVPQYVSSAADQVERFSQYVRSTNVRQMVNGVEQFARRQPGLFLGGALVLGLISARFLKSSDQGTASRSADASFGSDEYLRTGGFGAESFEPQQGRGSYASNDVGLSGRRENL